jgi:hypothetical protein
MDGGRCWRSGCGWRGGSDGGQRRVEEFDLGCEADETGGRRCGSAMWRKRVQREQCRENGRVHVGGPGVRVLGLGERAARPGQGRGALPPNRICVKEGLIGLPSCSEVLAMFGCVGRDLDLFRFAESNKGRGSEARGGHSGMQSGKLWRYGRRRL